MNQLPPEIWAQIFDFLPVEDIKMCREVCREWCWVASPALGNRRLGHLHSILLIFTWSTAIKDNSGNASNIGKEFICPGNCPERKVKSTLDLETLDKAAALDLETATPLTDPTLDLETSKLDFYIVK